MFVIVNKFLIEKTNRNPPIFFLSLKLAATHFLTAVFHA